MENNIRKLLTTYRNAIIVALSVSILVIGLMIVSYTASNRAKQPKPGLYRRLINYYKSIEKTNTNIALMVLGLISIVALIGLCVYYREYILSPFGAADKPKDGKPGSSTSTPEAADRTQS